MEIGPLQHLIKAFARLPGLGPRSARRIVLHLLKGKKNNLLELANMLADVAKNVKSCPKCGNIDVVIPCSICTNAQRDHTTLCVVEDVVDLWAMERNGIFKGVYHVLGGSLSAIDGRTPQTLNFNSLVNRVMDDAVKEVIVATNSTLDGQTTGFYIVDILKKYDIKITRLAHGIPIGAELDYLDEGTIIHALQSRQSY